MILSGTGAFVGFGFGAIQTGLFLYEAFRSGAFRRLVVAVAEAGELATAVPSVLSVKHFTCAAPGSLHRMLARAFQRKADRHGPPAVVYTSENHNHAAEILSEQVSSELPASERQAVFSHVRFLNTEVGKMSGVLSDPAEISACLGGICGAVTIAELRDRPGMPGFLRQAFVQESGGALIRKHAGADLLFSPAGYATYADDLLARMTTPFLED